MENDQSFDLSELDFDENDFDESEADIKDILENDPSKYFERNSSLVIDRYINSVVLFNDKGKKVRAETSSKPRKPLVSSVTGLPYSRPPDKKRVWYNRRTPQSINQISRMLNLIYENHERKFDFNKQEDSDGLLWLTLTTVQHKTQATDKYLFYCLKKLFQHEKFGYLAICERQRATTDIHYHVVIVGVARIDIHWLLNRWSGILGVKEEAALVDIKRVSSALQLSYYISKYVRKRCPDWEWINNAFERYGDKFKAPYSSLFECRTWSSGRIDKQALSDSVHEYRVKIPSTYLGFLTKWLQDEQSLDYITRYSYNDTLFYRAWDLYRLLRRAGLVD